MDHPTNGWICIWKYYILFIGKSNNFYAADTDLIIDIVKTTFQIMGQRLKVL